MKYDFLIIAVMVCAVLIIGAVSLATVNITRSFTLRTMSAPAQVYALCVRENERDKLECARIVRDMKP